jgi:hypothetical protein
MPKCALEALPPGTWVQAISTKDKKWEKDWAWLKKGVLADRAAKALKSDTKAKKMPAAMKAMTTMKAMKMAITGKRAGKLSRGLKLPRSMKAVAKDSDESHSASDDDNVSATKSPKKSTAKSQKSAALTKTNLKKNSPSGAMTVKDSYAH